LPAPLRREPLAYWFAPERASKDGSGSPEPERLLGEHGAAGSAGLGAALGAEVTGSRGAALVYFTKRIAPVTPG